MCSEEEDDLGKPYSYDPNFHGPIEKRRFTDVICLGIFLFFLLCWVVLGLFGFLNGHPERLLHPTDYKGRECGTGNFADLKYLYYFDVIQCTKIGLTVIKGCPTPQVCVRECPKVTQIPNLFSNTNRDSLICKPDLDPAYKARTSTLTLIKNGDCAPYIVASTPVLGRCLPAFDKAVANIFNPQANIFTTYYPNDFMNATSHMARFAKVYTWGQQVLYDFTEFWWMYLISLVFSMVVALIWIILMRWIAGFMVALNFFIVVGLLSFGIYYCFMSWNRLRNPNSPSIDILTTHFQPSELFANVIKDKETIKKTWLIFGIILSSILGILILITLLCVNRLRIAVALIREGSKAISLMMTTLFWPIVPFLLQLAIMCFWAILSVYLATTGYPAYQTLNIPASWALYKTRSENDPLSSAVHGYNLHELYEHAYNTRDVGSRKNDVIYTANFTQCDPGLFRTQLESLNVNPNSTAAVCQFMAYENHPWYPYMQFFNLFGLFWAIFFVTALNQITLAGAFSTYYWAKNKRRDIPLFVLFHSLGIALIYHVGSLAFGSLLLAITKMIRVVLEYLNEKAKNTHNPIILWLMRCIRCCFYCFERFLKFLNKNAFIMMAIHGKNFCQSAADGFSLVIRNVVRVVIVNKTTDFLLFMGQLVVMAATGYFFYFIYHNKTPFTDSIPKFRVWEFSLALQVLMAYFVSRIFFGVYEMAVETLFLCFLEDCERNDGTPSRPYFMSKELRNILHKKNIEPPIV